MNQSHENATEIKQELFAAVNSGEGFVSFYDEVFERSALKKRYIIKGGPGTGKSSFMKQVASYAERRGMTVEYYRCSSDPDSLDGIIVDGRIAMLDGTSPHAMDCELPGARDEIVNLGEFWDGDRLAERYNDIVSFGALKGNAYRKAYRFLSAAMEVDQINRELVIPSLRQEKMRNAVIRICREIPEGKGFCLTPGLMDSLGMKGRVRLDTYERQAKRLTVIEDAYQTGSLYLALLIEQARKKECPVRVSYLPLSPSLPNAVLFEESGDCFILGQQGNREPDGRINMKRFIDFDVIRGIKSEFRINRRFCEALVDSAIEALAEAGRYHFELETIYVSCMDFESQQRFCNSFCQKIR